jgi:hypothetical protein
MDSLDQGAMGLPCDDVQFHGDRFSFHVPSVNGSWSGTLAENGNELNGKWSQAGTVTLRLTRQETALAAKAPEPPKYDPALPPVPLRELKSMLDRDLTTALSDGALAPATAGAVVIGVVQHGAREIFVYGPAKTDSIFEIGSISKTFTGLILAQMVAQHKVKLEDPVRELLPAGTVTELTDRVAAAVFPLATLTTTPPAGAVVFSLTVAVDVAPPIRLAGASVTEEIAGGLIVKVALADPFNVAVIVSIVTTGTVLVSAVNFAVVAPAATFTVAGTEPADEVVESATTIPPAGAAAFSVTVPVAFAVPPSTLAGLTSTDRMEGRTTASLFDNPVVAPKMS